MSNLILGANSGLMMTAVYVVVLGALLYFMLIKPQKKQQQVRNDMLNNLSVNERIVTVGGITGYIRSLNGEYIYVEIAEGLVVEMTKQAVAAVLADDDAAEAVDEQNDDNEVEDANTSETKE